MNDDERRGPRWREDFPIEWERDHYVSRRELSKFLTLGSGLLVGASAAVAVRAATRGGPPPGEQRIASLAELEEKGSLLFRYPTPSDPCILLRGSDGAPSAFSQVCTHLSCAVVHAPEHDALHCPCHNATFSCRDGRPLTGPPERPLPRILVDVRGDDVYAVGVEA